MSHSIQTASYKLDFESLGALQLFKTNLKYECTSNLSVRFKIVKALLYLRFTNAMRSVLRHAGLLYAIIY